MVLVSDSILLKLLGKLSSYRALLTLQEAIKQHLNSIVNIIRPYVVSEMELGPGFTHSNHRLDVSDGNRNTTHKVGFTSDLSVELGDLVLVNFLQLWSNETLGVDQVLLEDFLVDQVAVLDVHAVVWKKHEVKLGLDDVQITKLVFIGLAFGLGFVGFTNYLGVVLHVRVDDEGG